ncbi:phage protease [Microbacterium oleivorans]|uniref:phage protease n=1 Tax=Microbacterium oleivorans TaxID=273677 RepID=UPI0033EF34EA
MTKKQLKTIALPFILKASADGSLPTEIEIARVGYWDTPYHGTFELTHSDFDMAVLQFQAGKYRVNGTEPLPGTLDHNGGESPAAFRITNIYRDGDSLMATVEWTELGKEKLTRDEYRYISFEYCTRANPMPNPENVNEMFVNVVTGATLTNDPLFKKLKPVLASARSGRDNDKDEGEHMDLSEIRAKKAEELTDEEKAFLNEHKAELTDDERTAFGIAADEGETEEQKAQREAEEQAAKEAAEKEAADKAAAEEAKKLEASTKGMTATQKAEFVKLKASVQALEADAQAGREAKRELERTKLTATLQAHANRGAIKNDQVGAGVDLLLASSEADRSKFTAFLDALPTNELLKAEAGTGGDNDDDVELSKEEIDLAAKFGNSEDDIKATKKAEAGK